MCLDIRNIFSINVYRAVQLMHEIYVCEGHVNALTFNCNGSMLFTAADDGFLYVIHGAEVLSIFDQKKTN